MKQKTDWLNVVKYAGAYIAFIIGSGSATGQEVNQFYTPYGIWGIGSVAISMFLFAWVGGTVTDMGFRTKGMEKVNAYGQICGKWLGTFYEYFVRIFLFAVVVVMISGAGAMLNEYYGPNYYVGSLLMAVLIFVGFAFGFNKLLDVIGCIGPVIIVFSIVVAVATIVSGSGLDLNVDITPIANMRSSANWWISGILYASYNIFGAIPFLTTMGAGSTSAREVKLGGILGGVVLMTAVLFMNAALLLRVDEIAQFAVPTLRLAKDISPVLGALFSVVLLCGIFSTAAPMMWTVCSKLAPVGTRKSSVIAAGAFGLGQLPFGTLVGFIYPYTGYLGILLLVCLAVQRIRGYIRKNNMKASLDEEV